MFDLFNIWQMQEYTFRLHEHSKFKWKPDLSPKDFMAVLANITAIKIRGSFVPDGQGFLDEVKLGSAARGQATGQATWIERSVLWSFCSVLISHIYTIQRIRYIRLIKLFCTLDAPVLRDIKETFASCVFQDTTMKIMEDRLQDVYHAVVMVIPSFVTGKLVMLMISQYW